MILFDIAGLSKKSSILQKEIESPEFIKAIVDSEDHFLFGIQLDGSIEWGNGIPAQGCLRKAERRTICAHRGKSRR